MLDGKYQSKLNDDDSVMESTFDVWDYCLYLCDPDIDDSRKAMFDCFVNEVDNFKLYCMDVNGKNV